MMRKPWRWIWQWRRQKGRCHYCDCRMMARLPASWPIGRPLPWDLATVDHLLPRSRGGTNTRKNTVLACLTCNTTKGDLSETEFLIGFARWLAARRDQVGRRRGRGAAISAEAAA